MGRGRRGRRGGKQSAVGKAKARAAAGKPGRGEKSETVCALRKRGSNGSRTHSPRAQSPVRPPSSRATKTFHVIRNGPTVPPAGVSQPVKELVSVGKLESNLCLFFAVFNVLQNDAERSALARGNESQPSNAFLSFMRDTSTKAQAKVTARKGNTRADICRYLEYLKDLKEISGFTWKVAQEFTALSVLQGQVPKKYVLLGSAATPIQFGNLKKKLAHKLKLENINRQNPIKKNKNKKHPVKQQSWADENGWIKDEFPELLSNRHAVSLIRTDHGEVYYYDNKNKKPRLIDRPCDLAAGLVYYDRAVEFDLTL